MVSRLYIGLPPVGRDQVCGMVWRGAAFAADIVCTLRDLIADHRLAAKSVAVDQSANALWALLARWGVFVVSGKRGCWVNPMTLARHLAAAKGRCASGENHFTMMEHQALKRPQATRQVWLAALGGLRALWQSNGKFQGVDAVPLTVGQVGSAVPIFTPAKGPDRSAAVPHFAALTLSSFAHWGWARLFDRPSKWPQRHRSRFAYGHVYAGKPMSVAFAGIGCLIALTGFGSTPETGFAPREVGTYD